MKPYRLYNAEGGGGVGRQGPSTQPRPAIPPTSILLYILMGGAGRFLILVQVLMGPELRNGVA